MNATHTALVTGATSGLGFEAAAQLAENDWSHVIITGRTSTKVEEARVRLVERTGRDIFSTLTVDLAKPNEVLRVATALPEAFDSIDFLLLNAGMVSGSRLLRNEEGLELTFASSLVGHHQLTMQLLADGRLSEDADIVIAGSEAARGDVPTFNPTDLTALADADYRGDRVAAAEALIRGTGVTYKPATAYADTKLFVAWWAAELSRRLPAGMSVNAVSPGSAPDTDAARHANFFMKHVMMPMFKHAPKRFGMSAPVSVAAARYLEVQALDGVTGEFFASAPKKMTGPIETMRSPHLLNEIDQRAAWEATVKVSGGIDYTVSV